jgi:hypothetical protein
VLRIRRQGMRDPRLGLRRQGVNFAIVIPGRASARTRVRNCAPYETDVHIDNTRTISKREVEYAPTVGLTWHYRSASPF